MDHRGSTRPSHRDVGSLYVRSFPTPTFLAWARLCKRCLPLALKRIEEDREQHKQLPERCWVQAQLRSYLVVTPRITRLPCAYSLATFLPLSENADLGLNIVFENEWEATSDWNEGDLEVVMEEM